MFKKILILLLVLLSFNIVGCSDFFTENGIIVNMPIDMGVLVWPDTSLTSVIPRPDSEKGKIEELSNDRFIVYISDVSKDYFASYVSDCMSSGFNNDFTYNKNIFQGKNYEGYSLYMKYTNSDIKNAYMSVNIIVESDIVVEKFDKKLSLNISLKLTAKVIPKTSYLNYPYNY